MKKITYAEFIKPYVDMVNKLKTKYPNIRVPDISKIINKSTTNKTT